MVEILKEIIVVLFIIGIIWVPLSLLNDHLKK